MNCFHLHFRHRLLYERHQLPVTFTGQSLYEDEVPNLRGSEAGEMCSSSCGFNGGVLSNGAGRIASLLVYDLTLLLFCAIYLVSDLAMPVTEQLIMFILCAIAALASVRHLRRDGDLLDASSRWLCAFAIAFIYWQARWLLLPEKFVPTHEGMPWQIPWVSLILILRFIAFAIAFKDVLRSPFRGVRQSTVSPSATNLSSVELQIRVSLIAACTLISIYALFMFVLLNARYPADMRIGYTVSVVTKAWEITVLLIMSSHHPTGILRRDIAMWALMLAVVLRAFIRAAMR